MTLRALTVMASMLLATVMVLASVNAQAEDAPLLIPEGKAYLISYSLDDPKGNFWTTVHDSVRAGRQIVVTHHVRMKPKGISLLHRTTAAKDWRKNVVYSLFENAYTYGTDQVTSRRTTREELVKNYILSVDDMPFVPRHKVKAGQVYTITVTLEANEKGDDASWLNYLPLHNLFKTKLTRSFTYVAK